MLQRRAASANFPSSLLLSVSAMTSHTHSTERSTATEIDSANSLSATTSPPSSSSFSCFVMTTGASCSIWAIISTALSSTKSCLGTGSSCSARATAYSALRMRMLA